jgi:hypothetical protein
LRSTVAGNTFLQPLHLHVEPPNALEEFGLKRLFLFMLAVAAVAKEELDAIDELLLPLTDLNRMDLKRLRQLGDGFGLIGGFHGHVGLERGRMPSALSRHDAPRDGSATVDQYSVPTCPVLVIHPELSGYKSNRFNWLE